MGVVSVEPTHWRTSFSRYVWFPPKQRTGVQDYEITFSTKLHDITFYMALYITFHPTKSGRGAKRRAITIGSRRIAVREAAAAQLRSLGEAPRTTGHSS